MEARLRIFTTLLAALMLLLLPCVRAQAGTVISASEFYFGSIMPGTTICYTNTVNSRGFRLHPVTRTVSFIPTTAQKNVRYIQVLSNDHTKFYAQIVNGGIGTANPTQTDIVLTSAHGTTLDVVVRIFCGA